MLPDLFILKNPGYIPTNGDVLGFCKPVLVDATDALIYYVQSWVRNLYIQKNRIRLAILWNGRILWSGHDIKILTDMIIQHYIFPLFPGMQSRYQVSDMGPSVGKTSNGAVLRIEPVRALRDEATYECIAENGVGDAVNAYATLTVFEGKGVLMFKWHLI